MHWYTFVELHSVAFRVSERKVGESKYEFCAVIKIASSNDSHP